MLQPCGDNDPHCSNQQVQTSIRSTDAGAGIQLGAVYYL